MLLDVGTAAVSWISTNVYYLSLLGMSAIIIFSKWKAGVLNKVFKYQFQLFWLILTILYVITFVISFGGLYYTIILSNIAKIAIVLAAALIEPDTFIDRFIRLVTFLAAVSLVIFVGYFIFGTGFWSPITSHLPVVRPKTISLGAQYGAFFLCFNYFDPSRNSYIFGEPGEYQLVISVALFLLLFMENKLREKEKNRSMVILLITMVTIQSTTGYFNLIVLVVCALIQNRINVETKILKRFLVFFGVFAILGILFFDGWDYFISKVLTEKIIDETGAVNFAQGTSSARWNGFIRLGNYLRTNFFSAIFGIGFVAREKTGITSCNGFANCVLDYGIVTVVWLVFNYAKSLLRYVGVLGCLSGLFIIMNTWFGQPTPLYTLIIVVAFIPMMVFDQPSQQ